MSWRKSLARRLRGLRSRPEVEPSVSPTPPAPEPTRYFYLGPDVALTRLTDGHHLFVDPQDESVGVHLIAHGYWEAWIHDVVRALARKGDQVVEVGANVGVYTVALAKAVGEHGHVVSLEANPRLAALVRRSVEFNGYSNRVTLLDKAATDITGPLKFRVSRANAGGGHTSVDSPIAAPGMTEIDVEAVRIDDLGLGPINLLRMDAEGSEPLILHGAIETLANPDIIVCMEWDILQMSARVPVGEFAAWLAGMGFRFWRIETDRSLTPLPLEAMGTLGGCEVVMTRRDLSAYDLHIRPPA